MEIKFNTKWKKSKQKRKKTKYRLNAPLHIKHKFLSANLSKALRTKYGRRSFPVRKGDNVKVMRGKFKGKAGKIIDVNLKRLKVSVENLQTQKKDGTKVQIFFLPSNLQIQELNLDDKKRIKALGKNKKPEAEEKTEEKKQDKKKIKHEEKEDVSKKK
tara:strand:+ start:1013 stop:1486 length:474 start_codon:yes stop_codon:yes gene_type:complete